MTFTSLEFGLLLALCLPLHWMLPHRARVPLLLISSYVFYAWWDWTYALLILATTVLDWGAALVIASARTTRMRKAALWVAVVGSLGQLAWFKYTNFALDTLRRLLGPLGNQLPGPLDIVLPVGISFYTFQTLGYVLDVYRGRIRAERSFLLVACFIAFFPQLVAGPIERAPDLMPQLAAERRLCARDLESGFRLILWGVLKKLVGADHLVVAAWPMYANPGAYGTGALLFSAAAMLIVIYLDFSAYSDIALGVARLFGVRLTRNFNAPLTAGSVADYWRRWHITLSIFMRDNVFLPLGGGRQNSEWREAVALLVTLTLIGVWHGAAWTFIFWGLSNGLTLLAYRHWRRRVLSRIADHPIRRTVAWRLGSWATTTAVRVPATVFFFAPSLAAAGLFFRGLLWRPTTAGFSLPHIQLGLLMLVAFWVLHWAKRAWPPGPILDARPPWARGVVYATLLLLVLFFSVDRSTPFIYYQF
jgi:alginate O-acetyltransferase complex protein AlgI